MPFKNKPVWTETMISVMRSAADRGKSASTVAYLLGKSRSSVIGAALRNGIKFHNSNNGGGRHRVRHVERAAPIPKIIPPRIVRTELLPTPVVPVPKFSFVADGAIRFLDLDRGQCKWIDGEPAFDALACGAAAHGPYCADHRKMAYEAPSRRPRKSGRNVWPG